MTYVNFSHRLPTFEAIRFLKNSYLQFMLLNKKFTKLKIALPLQLIIYGADELYHCQIHDIKHCIGIGEHCIGIGELLQHFYI